MTESPAFAHPPLDRSLEQIRLLTILDDDPGEPIRCLLETHNISGGRDYIALSYTWGPEFPQKPIEINGSASFVRQNLFNFLAVARDQLKGKLLWIDQICVDQFNVGEKNHQVSLMSRIHNHALYVIAWLGAEGDDSGVALSYIEMLLKASEQEDCSMIDDYSRQGWPGRPENMPPRVLSGLLALFARPYWTRLWIIQEIMLARKVVLLCGSRQLQWSRMENFVAGQRWLNIAEIINTRVLQLFLIHKPLLHSDGTFTNGNQASSLLLDPILIEDEESIESFRSPIYKFCEFECSDPRDKIYGLLGIQTSVKGLKVDYSKSATTVFWDFFTMHLAGIDHVRCGTIGSPIALPIEEIMDDWWHFVVRLMNCMGINNGLLRKDVATLLAKTFDELQRVWLSRGSLQAKEPEDITEFFAQKLGSTAANVLRR